MDRKRFFVAFRLNEEELKQMQTHRACYKNFHLVHDETARPQ